MKRFTVMITVLTMLFSLAACSKEADQSNKDLKAQSTDNMEGEGIMNHEDGSSNKTAVIYFSATGTTKSIAEEAAEILNADIYEIVPEIPYTEEDLAYYTDGRADQEQNDISARPKIVGHIENMQNYDTILLGYPIWHGQAPRIISTFLESYDFSGKTIVTFCTSQSSDIGSSSQNLHTLAENADWLDGRRFAAGTSKQELEEWLGEIGILSEKAESQSAFDFERHTVMLNSGYEIRSWVWELTVFLKKNVITP
ncbi:flavodoxin [Holdemania massiliensis]|uniref:flavodoxin n=1 Tax=Holdemania massiliensis TaxID=1468449 RepID=UPI002676ACB9|nr:flavodoxin [Holdemania massiliensis]